MPRSFTNTSSQDRATQSLETELRENEARRQERSLRLDTIRQEDGGEEDMVVLKSLLRMFPIWGLYLVVCLVSATGSTFFLEQYSDLNVVNSIPIQIYNLAQSLSGFAIKYMLYWTSGRGWICGFCKNHKVKIGVGMLCGIISCIFAWELEVHRLKVVDNKINGGKSKSLSFLWLLPQFCMLGCMEELTDQGLLEFFKSQIKFERIQSFGEEYKEFVVGLGTLMNIFLILIFKSRFVWFGDDINNSRLDKYYMVLVCVFSANFIIYCFVATCFYKDVEQLQEEANNNLQQDQHQPLANDSLKKDHQCLADDDSQHDQNLIVTVDLQQGRQLWADDDSRQDHQVKP
ncbi:hypothetical protein L2E82_35182 [Cichorium intybus]|uniref:Uncharacterized protein n=1 Tax=Cichorium intybus TaxID=13427 RepID=A0ACB9BNI2_CICIN|nr:hypothetical protein L2E82_35182 [Cichorium intybus]